MAQSVLMQLVLEVQQFRANLEQATNAMRSASNRISAQAQRTSNALQKTTASAGRLGKMMEFVKTRIIGAGLFFAAFYQGLILLRQGVGDVISEFFNLDDALRRVQSITLESDESINRLKDDLLDLARSGDLFDQTASAVADSMFTIAQAGFSTAESLQLARLAAEGAAVGFTTAEVSAKVLVNVLKAYDLPVSQARDVMDILFQTVDTGILTFEDLSNNLGRVLASASALSIPLQEITGTVATLTLRGFTAAQAMTSVNRILQTFIRPSTRAKEAAAALGIELTRDALAAEGLVPMLNKMWIAAEKDANVFAEMFDRIQSTRGALSLMTDDGALLSAVMIDMGMSTEDAGRMAEALEQVTKSLKFQMSILRSQILAVTTGAFQPLTGAIAAVLKKINDILAGRNAFFSFFSDLSSLVLALVFTFLYLQRQAIASMFMSMGRSVMMLGDTMRLTAMQSGVLSGAMVGLRGILSTLAPMLMFLAVFAMFKFAGKFDPIAKAAKNAQIKLEEFNEELSRQQDFLERGIITPEQFGLGAWESAAELITKVVAEDFGPAMDKAMFRFNSFGEGVATVASGLKRVFTGDFRDATTVVRDNFNEFISELVQGLEDAGARSGQIADLSAELYGLARASSDPKLREMLSDAAFDLHVMAEETAEIEENLILAAKRGEGLTDVFGDTVITAEDITSSIEAWAEPIEKAKKLAEEILGLTTKQDIILTALIEPIEDKIAMRNARIAELKEEQFGLANDIGVALSDIEDGENAIFDTMEKEIGLLEEANDWDDARIETMQTQLDLQKELNETQAAGNVLSDLQNGVYDTLTGELLPEQVRLLERVVHDFLPNGAEGMREWVRQTDAMGQTLDEDVLDALLLIVDGMENNELSLDVRQALENLGLVSTRLNSISERFPIAWTPGSQFGRFQHGVENFVGGMALVGEAGPELVRLPRGTDVYSNADMGQALRSGAGGSGGMSVSAEVNITTSLLEDFVALKKQVLRAVDEQLDDAAAKAGISAPRYGTFGAGIPRV